MLGPDSGIGSARVVVARRAVSLLSNRIFGVRTIRMQDLCYGTILRSWTKNTLIGFCSGERPLGCGPVQRDPQNPAFRSVIMQGHSVTDNLGTVLNVPSLVPNPHKKIHVSPLPVNPQHEKS